MVARARIKHLGTVKIPCNLKGSKTMAITFCILDTEGPAIMGLYTATELNLTKFNLKICQSPPERSQPEPCKQPNNSTPIRNKEGVIAQYPESFDGIGKSQGEYHIIVVPSVPLVVHPPRKLPISMKDEIKKELNDKISGSTT